MELLEDCNPIAIMEFHCNGRTRRPTGGPGSIFPGRLVRLLRWDSMIALGLLWDSELWLVWVVEWLVVGFCYSCGGGAGRLVETDNSLWAV